MIDLTSPPPVRGSFCFPSQTAWTDLAAVQCFAFGSVLQSCIASPGLVPHVDKQFRNECCGFGWHFLMTRWENGKTFGVICRFSPCAELKQSEAQSTIVDVAPINDILRMADQVLRRQLAIWICGNKPGVLIKVCNLQKDTQQIIKSPLK